MWFSLQNFPGALNDCRSQGFTPCHGDVGPSGHGGTCLAQAGWVRSKHPPVSPAKRRNLPVHWLFSVFNKWTIKPLTCMRAEESHLGPHHLVNRIWTETLSANTATCCETAKCLATPSSLQSSNWRGRKAGGVRYAARKLQIREAKCAAICTACTTWSYTRERQRNPTVGRASAGSGKGAGNATGTAAAFPFAGQDGFLNIKRQMRLCRHFSNSGWAHMLQSPVSAELCG